MTEEFIGLCPHCGAGFTAGSVYCHYCGNALSGLPSVPAAPTSQLPTKATAVSRSTGLSYEPYVGKWYIAPFVNKVRRYKVYRAHQAQVDAIESAALAEHESAVRLQAKKDAISAKYQRPGALEPGYKKAVNMFMGLGQAWSNYGKRVQEREAAFKKKRDEERAKKQ